VPSVRGKVVPVPAVQLVPLSVLYSQVALASRLVRLTVTRLVIPSVFDAPESTASFTPRVLMVMLRVGRLLFKLPSLTL